MPVLRLAFDDFFFSLQPDSSLEIEGLGACRHRYRLVSLLARRNRLDQLSSFLSCFFRVVLAPASPARTSLTCGPRQGPSPDGC